MKTDERNKFAIKSFLNEYLDLKKSNLWGNRKYF